MSEQTGHGGYEGHGAHGGHGDHAAMFRGRFWLTLVLAVPVVVLSPSFQHLLGYQASFPGSWLASPLLGTLVVLYGGWPFLAGAAAELRSRRPGMMLLIGMAITVGFAASAATFFGLFSVEVWWELALLIAIMLLGPWLEMCAIGQASGALAALAELLPDEAERVTEDGIEPVNVDRRRRGAGTQRGPGARGRHGGAGRGGSRRVDGQGRVAPGTARRGRACGGRHGGDRLRDPRTGGRGRQGHRPGRHSAAGRRGASSRSRAQTLADRAAALLFYVAVAAAVVTVVVWSLLGQPAIAVPLAVTVLIIACPHALGLAIPLVVAISTSLSARTGILVKDRLALEWMRSVDAVLFDKTAR